MRAFRIIAATIVVLTLSLGSAAAQTGTPALPSATPSASAPTFQWARYDVALTVDSSYTLQVEERETLQAFDSPLSEFQRDISVRTISDVTGIRLAEHDRFAGGPYLFVAPSVYAKAPGTYTIIETADSLRVEWAFPPTRNADRTFVISYQATGAIRDVALGGTRCLEIRWTAISDAITATAPVRDATVTVMLAGSGVTDPSQVLVSPVGFVAVSFDANQTVWKWRRSDLPAGDKFVVHVVFPLATRPAVPIPTPTPDAAKATATATPATASAWGQFLGEPASSECVIPPLTAEQFHAALSGPWPQPPLTVPQSGARMADFPSGPPPDPVQAAEVLTIVREVFACGNAGEAPRSFALLTPALLQRTIFGIASESVASPSADQIRAIEADYAQMLTETPTPATEPTIISAIDNVRALPDGRLLAVVGLQDPYDTTPSEWWFFIFKQSPDGWRIDEMGDVTG